MFGKLKSLLKIAPLVRTGIAAIGGAVTGGTIGAEGETLGDAITTVIDSGGSEIDPTYAAVLAVVLAVVNLIRELYVIRRVADPQN